MEGYVYILINDAMPGLVKIGCTKRSPEERKRELSRWTGIPLDFSVAYEIFSSDMKMLEKTIHKKLDSCRVNKNKEFFKCDIDFAIASLSKIAQEIQLDMKFKVKGVNEVFDYYEAIEIYPYLQNRFPSMLREEIKSIRIYQTKIRCYLEITEEEEINVVDYKPFLMNQKIFRQDLAYITEDSLDEFYFDPKSSVSENARRLIEEFDDYSMYMCCGELFTDEASSKIQNEYLKKRTIHNFV